MSKKILLCPCCDGVATLNESSTVFIRQNYSDRYKEPVASQSNGFQIRCLKCGLQTCWWHYKQEAIDNWNTRTPIVQQPLCTSAQEQITCSDHGPCIHKRENTTCKFEYEKRPCRM